MIPNHPNPNDQRRHATKSLAERWIWYGYWTVASLSCTVFLAEVHWLSGGLLVDGSATKLLFGLNLPWTFLGWVFELAATLLLLRDRKITWYDVGIVLLCGGGARCFCFRVWPEIMAAC